MKNQFTKMTREELETIKGGAETLLATPIAMVTQVAPEEDVEKPKIRIPGQQ